MTRITGTLHEKLCTLLTISRSVILRMRNVSEKKEVVEKIKTSIFFETRAFYEIIWKNTVEPGQATDHSTG